MGSADTGGSPSKPIRQPAKQKVAGKAKAGVKRQAKAQSQKVQKAGTGETKAGRKSRQAGNDNSTNRQDEEDIGIEAVSGGQKASRKGKQAPVDRQKQKAATAKPASRRKPAHNQADKGEHTAASSDGPSSPVSVTKAQPARRGKKALSDGSEQDDSEAAAQSAQLQEARSRPGKATGKANPKAAAKGGKAGSQGQRKGGKAQQPSTRQQPR